MKNRLVHSLPRVEGEDGEGPLVPFPASPVLAAVVSVFLICGSHSAQILRDGVN